MNAKTLQILGIIASMTVKEFGDFLADFELTYNADRIIKVVNASGVKVKMYRVRPRSAFDGTPKKIQCIKLVREFTGWGLKESKDFMDGTVAANLTALTYYQITDLRDDLWYNGFEMYQV